MVLITFIVVVMRYVFSIGFVWMQESYVWLHSGDGRAGDTGHAGGFEKLTALHVCTPR